MRTIKFRGKRLDNGEWVCGNLFVPNKLIKGVHISPEPDYADFYPHKDDEGNQITDEPGIALGLFYEVDPETVGQFTGLLDKNGNEIYEGDQSLLFTDDHLVTVVWLYSKWMLKGDPLTFSGGSPVGYGDLYLFSKHLNITGTIHDKQTKP